MANPSVVNCPEAQWTLVGSNMQNGYVHVLTNVDKKYKQTYRVHLSPPPTQDIEGVQFHESLTVSSAERIDIYVWPVDASIKVRVDQ